MQNNKVEAKKLEILQDQLNVHKNLDRGAGLLLHFAMVLTGLMYFMFEKHLFLGEAITWSAYFGEWHSALDFLLMFIIVVMSAVFLAWVKHHAYLHFGLYGSIGLIVFTVIGFALFAEFFSSSASQDTKSRVLLNNDKAYQATIAQPATSTPPTLLSSGNAEAIAKAEKNYARCKANLGKPGYKHCDGDKATLESLKASDAASLNAAKEIAVQTNTANQKANFDRQDKLKADSYNAVIVSMAKFISSISGTDYKDNIKTATVFTMLIVAVAFEILHHFLSHSKERAQNAVYGIELELARNDGGALPDKPDSVIPKSQPEKIPFGFISTKSPSTASSDVPPPLFKYQEAKTPAVEKIPFGFVPSRKSGETMDAENRRKYPQTIVMPTGKGQTASDYHDVPRKDSHTPTGTHLQATVGKPEPLQLPVIQLPVGEGANSGKSSVYAMAEQAKVGQVIACPCCGKSFTKANKWHLFCSNNRKPREDSGNCSDDWHNAQNPERLAAAQAKARKRKG